MDERDSGLNCISQVSITIPPTHPGTTHLYPIVILTGMDLEIAINIGFVDGSLLHSMCLTFC